MEGIHFQIESYLSNLLMIDLNSIVKLVCVYDATSCSCRDNSVVLLIAYQCAWLQLEMCYKRFCFSFFYTITL